MSSESEAAVKTGETNQPLKSLGKYLIERKLGQGGMGTVYLAKHTELKKMIALKVLPRDKAKNPILVRRFKAEAQAAAQLEHPNIVAVYDTGEMDGYLYIAMEYVEGVDLFEQVKRRGAIPVKRSIEIIKQVASALQHAFEQNIVHRDIKPSNLLLRHDGTVKVTDLGLARSIDDTLETNITRAGTTVGTVDYMAPEQARSSKSADIRSDIYSLGCTWYQMLTGEPPFPEGSLTNKLQAHAIKPLPDPRELNENIPEGLFAVLQRMTAKKPEDRYQTPAELLEDLAHSKLTKAAFSNEIFSDLSDYDVDALKGFAGDADPADEGDEDRPPDETPRRKTRSSVGDESDEPSARPARKKNRPHDEDESEESSPEPSRRKTRARVDEEADNSSTESTRRKTRSRDGETSPLDDTQPLKSKHRPSAKSYDDEYEEEGEEESRNSSKRTSSSSRDEEPDEPTSSKRKRTVQTSDESKSPNPKQSKGATGNEASEKRGPKHVPKPLPPKRQPVPIEDDNRGKLNLESLKYIGIAAGVLTVIGGLGWLIVQWSTQVESGGNNPFAQKAETPVDAVATQVPIPKSVELDKSTPNVSITVVDPPKPGPPERTATSEYDIAKQPLPAWSTAAATEPRDLPIFSVGPGATSQTHFSNLDEALRAADKAGGLVRLIGNGPFLLSRVEIGNAKKLVIAAATPQDQPLIIVKPAEPGSITGLTLNSGALDLRGLHFVLERTADSNPSVLISVVDGQLFVRNCSFTATGNDAVALTALAFTSKQDSQNVSVIEPQVLLDRVTVRGNGLTALQVHRTTAEIVIQDSLLVAGTAPAIDVAGSLSQGSSDATHSRPRRTIRVLRSTFCARKQVLELAAENTTKPPTTVVFFQDSICSAEGAGNTTVLASAIRWPSITSTTTGWLTNLNWASKSSLYIGFERLMDMDKTSFKVAGLDTWQRVWGTKFESVQFQPFAWQESLISDLSAVQPYDFDTSKLPFRDLTTSKGTMPGCATIQLTVPNVISQSRLVAIGQRPKPPAVAQKSAEGSPSKKVNLTIKEDLGVILNKNDWQSGTVFEVTGSGLQMMQPAKIVGKSLRIIFRQGDGLPLKLQPKVHDFKAKPDNPGLFTVENGTLDLQSAIFEAPQTAKGAAPPWLIHARNSNIILHGCQLSGPMQQDLEQHQGLIEWSTTAANPQVAGAEPQFLSVNDSLLMSTGVGIRFQSSGGQLFLNNCIVAVRGYGLDLQPIRTGTGILPIVDLQHVTFSTSKAAIRIEAAMGTEVVSLPMRLFVDYCAVVPPLEFKPGDAAESTVVECAGPVLEQKQIEWWGTSNGFAKEVKSLLRQSGTDPITSITKWHTSWGESNDFRLLTGPKGIRLNNSLPNKWTSLKMMSFFLDPNSTGATWADGGRPVGADIRVVEDVMLGKKGPTEPKPATPSSTPKPGTSSSVGGKKNVGF